MQDDNYDDGDSSTASAPPSDSSSPSCLLPASAFPDAAPGDMLTVRVVAVHGSEIEVQPSGTDDDDDQDENGDAGNDATQPAPPPAGGGMGDMMQ